MKIAGKALVGLFIVLVGAALLFVTLHRSRATVAGDDVQPVEISGSLEAEETDVNVKIPGRVAQMLVDEGDEVTAGQVIAVMEADNIEAKANLAKAALAAATFQYEKARNGARPQQLEQAREMMAQASTWRRALTTGSPCYIRKGSWPSRSWMWPAPSWKWPGPVTTRPRNNTIWSGRARRKRTSSPPRPWSGRPRQLRTKSRPT